MEKILKYSLVALLGISVAMIFWAVFTTPEDPTTETATAVGAYLYWGYFLMGAALVAALVGAGMDLLKKPFVVSLLKKKFSSSETPLTTL